MALGDHPLDSAVVVVDISIVVTIQKESGMLTCGLKLIENTLSVLKWTIIE